MNATRLVRSAPVGGGRRRFRHQHEPGHSVGVIANRGCECLESGTRSAATGAAMAASAAAWATSPAATAAAAAAVDVVTMTAFRRDPSAALGFRHRMGHDLADRRARSQGAISAIDTGRSTSAEIAAVHHGSARRASR